MADDYMSDGGEFEAAPEAEPAEPKGTKTTLIPIDFFEGKNLEPGTTCEVKIAKVHDDQVEVEYVPHAEEAELGEELAAMPSGMEEMMT